MAADGRIRVLRVLKHPITASLLLAAALHLLWLAVFASSGGDLAAQDAWAEFAEQHPDSAYNMAWYGGMHPVSYSVMSPYLMALLGVRTTVIIAGTLSAGLLALILVRSPVRRPMVPALWGAFALTCNAASGRATFAIGVLFALGAVAVVWAWPLAWRRRWRWARGALAALLAGLATAGSPVAGLFLWVVAGGLFLGRRRAAAFSLALTPPLVVACSALLFPFKGVQPMPFVSVAFPVIGAVAVALFAPREWRTVRLGAWVYGIGVLLTWLIPSQVGSNVERLSLLFGGVVLLAVMRTTRVRWRSRTGVVLVASFVVIAGWTIGKPTYDIAVTTPAAAWTRDVTPLLEQLERVHADRARVEVVPVSSHREASALAPHVNLARGWNRQADTDRNPLFYDGSLTPERYHDWLRRWAVHYVVLPRTERPDISAREEAELVRGGLPFLEEVWSDRHWTLYRVADALPLADPPAEVERATANEVTVTVREAGAVLMRIPWSPWLSLVDGDGERLLPPKEMAGNEHGCLRPAPPSVGADGDPPPEGDEADGVPVDRWTLLEAPKPGTYRIGAPYKLPRGTQCPDA